MDMYYISMLEEADSLLFPFVLPKPFFSIFHTNYLINLLLTSEHSPINGVGKNINENSFAYVRHFYNFIINYEKDVHAHSYSIGSSGRDCVLIILLQLYDSKTSLFEDNLFYLVQCLLPPTFILEQ